MSLIYSLNPVVHFGYIMLRTAQHWCTSSASAERVGQGEVGEGAVRMAAARMGHEGTWLALVGPVLTPDCMDRLRKHYSDLAGG